MPILHLGRGARALFLRHSRRRWQNLEINPYGLILAFQDVVTDAPKKPPLLLFDLTDRILGVFFEVYNELGPGFQEFVCRRALVIGLQSAGLEVREEVPLPVWFRGNRIASFRADLVIPTGPVLIEVKGVPSIEPFHVTQVLGYLKATEIEVSLILNFGRRPQYKRLVFENVRKTALHGGGQLEEC